MKYNPDLSHKEEIPVSYATIFTRVLTWMDNKGRGCERESDNTLDRNINGEPNKIIVLILEMLLKLAVLSVNT